MVDEEDLNLQLLAGMSIEIDGLGTLYPLTLKEVIMMGEKNYNKLASYLCLDKSMVDEFKDREDISNLEILMFQSCYDEKFRDIILNAFKLFLNKEISLTEEGIFYFEDKDGYKIIDKPQFEDFQFVLRKANNFKTVQEPQYNPGNERAAKFIEKMLKNKSKKQQKKSIDLHSMISGVAWKAPNINIFNVYDLTIYQLYDAFYRLEMIDNYQHTMNGIYAGTIDGKSINLSNINWAKILTT